MKILHLCVDNLVNAGDIVVKEATRKRILGIFPEGKILTVSLYKKIAWNEKSIDYLNKSFDLVVIGAGGLLLHDSNANTESDWQWKIRPEIMRLIRRPILVYSIGFNLFRGHREFSDIFSESVNTLVSMVVDMSLRHNGCIDELKQYVDPELHKRLHFTFCPTLVFRPLSLKKKDRIVEKKTIGILCAGDRLSRRHADTQLFVKQMIRCISYLKKSGYKVYYVSHMDPDKWFLSYYTDFDKVIDLGHSSCDAVYDAYERLEYVIADRGHAQMIPFSVGCKTIVPISHNKLKRFFDDVHMPEYGVEEDTPGLSEILVHKVIKFDEDKWRQQQEQAMRLIFDNTIEAQQRIQRNMRQFQERE